MIVPVKGGNRIEFAKHCCLFAPFARSLAAGLRNPGLRHHCRRQNLPTIWVKLSAQVAEDVSTAAWEEGDLTGDGVIDDFDLDLAFAQYGIKLLNTVA